MEITGNILPRMEDGFKENRSSNFALGAEKMRRMYIFVNIVENF